MTESESMDWVTAQTRLLRSPKLRAQFRRDPVALGQAFDLSPENQQLLARLCPDQLDAQARTLIDKRMHEAFQLLPQTVANLAANARSLFVSHALQYWPDGHQRHTADALAFCESLPSDSRNSVDPYEVNRLRFRLTPTPVRIHWIARRTKQGSGFLGFHVLFLLSRRLRQFQLGIALPE